MSYQKVYMNQIYSSSIMRQVAQMWKNQLLCDAVIKTGNIQTKAHRLVLIAACPMLQDRENASVGSHLEVRLNSDISEAAVNTFLQYLYEGYMMLTEENCREVEKIAKMLHVDSVTKCCSDFQKCMNAKRGYSSYQGLNFDLQDSVDFRFVYTTDLQKMAPDSQNKRQFDDVNMTGPASKRPRSQPFSSFAANRPDDHMSMNDSYSRSHDQGAARGQNEGVIDISEESVELVNVGPAARDPDGWPVNTDLPPLKTSSSVSVAHQQGGNSDIQIIDVQSIRRDQQNTFGRMEDSRSDTLGAGTSSGLSERHSHIPSTVRHMEDSNKYMSSTTARENIVRSSPLSSSPPKSVQKQRIGTEDIHRSFALGSAVAAASDHGPFSIPSSSSYKSADVTHNLYEKTHNSDTNSTNRVSSNKSAEEQRPAPSPEPIIVKLEDETTESESIELYIQNPSNDSFSQDPGGDSLGEFDPDLSNDDSMSMEHGQPNSTMDDQSQDVSSCGLQCRFCKRVFEQFGKLVQHLRVDENYIDVIELCTICCEVFYSSQAHQDHLIRFHLASKNQCPICSVVVKHACNFRRHVASHSMERPFVCSHCKSSFKRKDHLKDHLLKCNRQ
nr:zinc finger protein 37 isoform X8 [Crassostrea gigas]